MGNYILTNINIDKKILQQINDLMNTEILDEAGNIRFQMHKGSKQQWYREIIEEGLNKKYQILESKKKELQNEDKNDN